MERRGLERCEDYRRLEALLGKRFGRLEGYYVDLMGWCIKGDCRLEQLGWWIKGVGGLKGMGD